MRQHLLELWIRRKAMLIAVVLLAGSGVVLGAVRFSRRAPTVPTYEVKRGEFQDSEQFRGEVKALKSVTISAPADAGDLQIIKLSTEGAAVKPDEVVVEFDKTKTEQDLAQYRSSLRSAEASIEQARAQARLAEEEDKTAVLKARFEVEGARLEATKQEIVSEIEGEEAKLKVLDAEQKLREAETKQKSDQALNKATIESAEQTSSNARYDVQRAERALAQMSLRAPSAGTITILQHWAGGNMAPYRTGDRAWPGAAIAELPDASTLRISTRVDETERGRLALNLPVTVQLNAIPDRQFTGHIEGISQIASLDFSGGWPITRNFTLEILLDQTDSRFKPGITGQVTVVVDHVPNAISIPAQALFQKSGQNVAYVWAGSQFEEREVEVGRRSGDRVLIAKGLNAGELVALRDPTAKE
ncbi:MAG TPA: efflux RND transporter periplasmic adaptor subunit [Candidatus Dormibacteraeota bacterium]|nr:efflux RND transporter periplasmic adaptor subunit [Candidatus Dormibacteraeota bacterium]